MAQPGDREPAPLSVRVRPPMRPALHDRDVTFREIRLNANLRANTFRNPSATPPLHPSNVQLRQATHATSLNEVWATRDAG